MKNSQKGFIVPLLIILAGVLVIGVGSYIYFQNKNTQITQPINTSQNNYLQQNTQIATTSANIAELSQATSDKITKDSAQCATISNQQNRDMCYKYAALGDQEPSLCLKIEEQYPKDECYNNFAGLTKDVSYCNKIQTPSMKTNCLTALGNVGGSGYRITNPGWSNPQICDPGSIENQSQNVQDSCYKEFAMEYKDVTLCSKIQSASVVESCYGQVAISSKNPDICKMYSTQDKQNQCYATYAFYTGAQYCSLITGGTDLQSTKDSCYSSAAISSKDVKACNNIIASTVKTYCIQNAQ
jgi:hypothetical protein